MNELTKTMRDEASARRGLITAAQAVRRAFDAISDGTDQGPSQELETFLSALDALTEARDYAQFMCDSGALPIGFESDPTLVAAGEAINAQDSGDDEGFQLALAEIVKHQRFGEGGTFPAVGTKR